MRCDAMPTELGGVVELVMGSFSGGSRAVDRNAAKPRARSDGGTYLEAWTLNCLDGRNTPPRATPGESCHG